MHSRRVKANGLDFAYLEEGPADGPMVLLLHGFPDNALSWERQIPVLAAAGYRTVAPWLRGVACAAWPVRCGVACAAWPVRRGLCGVACAAWPVRRGLCGVACAAWPVRRGLCGVACAAWPLTRSPG